MVESVDGLEQRVLIRYGNLGEVSRGRHYFKAEVRGLAHELQQAQGRIINMPAMPISGMRDARSISTRRPSRVAAQ